jgi:uncharacterized protein
MSTLERLESEARAALKEGNAMKVSVLRMVISAVKTLMIEKNLKAADEGEVLQILQKQIKQHKDSIAQFEKGKRQDLVDKEAQELTILEAYMPKQLSEQEVTAIVKEVISETGLSSKADKGKVIKAVMEKVKGRSDGKVINDLVTSMLK